MAAAGRGVMGIVGGPQRPRREIVAMAARFVKEELPGIAQDIADDLATAWKESESDENVVRPKKPPVAYTEVSAARGKKWYLSEKTMCQHCHGPEGKGDGKNTRVFWPIPNSQPERKYTEAGLHDDWGSVQILADLNQGIYRGGDDLNDLFRRIVEGIPGTQMPGYKTVLSDDDVWDVVNFLQSLRPEQLRGKAVSPRRQIATGSEK